MTRIDGCSLTLHSPCTAPSFAPPRRVVSTSTSQVSLSTKRTVPEIDGPMVAEYRRVWTVPVSLGGSSSMMGTDR